MKKIEFDPETSEREFLQKLALYHLNVYDVTEHDDKFDTLEIKHCMEDGEDGWFKASSKTKKDVVAAEMYDDLKEGQEKYLDTQIIKDTTALYIKNEDRLFSLGFCQETITAVFRKKLFYIIIPKQLEELLKLTKYTEMNDSIVYMMYLNRSRK